MDIGHTEADYRTRISRSLPQTAAWGDWQKPSELFLSPWMEECERVRQTTKWL